MTRLQLARKQRDAARRKAYLAAKKELSAPSAANRLRSQLTEVRVTLDETSRKRYSTY